MRILGIFRLGPIPLSFLLLLVLPPLPLRSQTSDAGGVALDSAQRCPYEVCGLRIVGNTIVRGYGWEPVGRLGPLGGDVRILLQGPDETAVDARRYQRLQRLSGVSGVLAVPLGTLGLLAIANGPADYHDDEIIPFAIGWTLGLYLLNRAIVLGASGRHAVDRAVWAYNRPYAPDGLPPPPLYPVKPRQDPSAWLILGGGALGALVGGLDSRDNFYWGTLVGAGTGALLSAVLVRW